MIDLRLANCALLLDKHRNFARAAAAVGVTQPTFSRNIAALEADLGVRLFDRSRRRVEPTAEGRVFLAHAANLLAEEKQLREELQELGGLRSGELSIGAGPYPLEISVLEAAARLSAKHPAVRIEIIEGQWREFMPRLLAGEIDIAVAETSVMAAEPRLKIELLPAHTGVAFCRQGHPLSGRRKLRLEDILSYPLVGVRVPPRLSAFLSERSDVAHADPRTGDLLPRITTTSFASAREIVRLSDGVGFAALTQIAEDVRSGRLAALDFDAREIKTAYGMVRLVDRTPSPAALAFMQLLREVEQEHRVQGR
jgi:LysR family transcriptional regulator of gallate degradation